MEGKLTTLNEPISPLAVLTANPPLTSLGHVWVPTTLVPARQGTTFSILPVVYPAESLPSSQIGEHALY